MDNIKKIITSDGVTSIYFDVHRGWRQVVYLMSDVHFDSVFCARDIYFAHLKEAKSQNALIFDGGDFFDAMQGRFDPRRSMDELRPEYRRDDYFDFVVADAAKHLAPYAENIVLMASGNHELMVRKNSGTDLTQRLTNELGKNGSKAVNMGYKGWVRFMMFRSGNPCGSLLLRLSHSGGGQRAPVTRGVIDTNRQAVYLPDADVVWNGHIHQGWVVVVPRERLSNKGTLYQDYLWFVRSPGYKNDYISDQYGYSAITVKGPSPIGCIRVELLYDERPHLSAELLINN